MKRTTMIAAALLASSVTVSAQVKTDTLAQNIRSYVARNFSEVRTFNLYWETTPAHSYRLTQNGQEIEKGRMRDVHTIKFQTTVPVLRLKNFSIYANLQFNSYQFKTVNDATGKTSSVFSEEKGGYSFYEGGISATYRTRLAGKPLILTASCLGDGWSKGFEKVQGNVSAIMIIKRTASSSFSAGLYAMSLFQVTPIIPIIAYSRQFTPSFSIDIALPSRTYMRYQIGNNHRFSLGASLSSEHYYMKPGLSDVPETCYYNESFIKPEFVYECIINKHVYLIARGGGMATISGGLYGTDRKGIDNEPFVKMNHPITPFFNIGFSYNLFK